MRLRAATIWIAVLSVCLASFASIARAGDLECAWRELPTVAKARAMVAARLGRGAAVRLINRFPDGGLSRHLRRCGFDDSLSSVRRVADYWTARAAQEISAKRVRLSGLNSAKIRRKVDGYIPPAHRKGVGEALLNRRRGVAEPMLLALLDTVDASRRKPPTPAQKRLIVEYAVSRAIVLGLRAGATAPLRKPER